MALSRRVFLGSVAAMTAATGAMGAEIKAIPVRENGIVGVFHLAPDMRRRPVVVMLNGSDGGTPSARSAADLVASGYPVLSLAYFQDWNGQPAGLPASLNAIPLDYVFRAIDWLKAQPAVDAGRIVLMGESRGGELALLVASLRPDVAGVMTFSASSRVWNGIPRTYDPATPPGPAWTLGGRPVPFQTSVPIPDLPMRQWFERVSPIDAARIRVENIRGPILLVSSKADGIWPGNLYADEIAAHLQNRRDHAAVRNLQFDDASHLLMGVGPGITTFEIPGTGQVVNFGGTPAGTVRARAEAWDAAKQFLARM